MQCVEIGDEMHRYEIQYHADALTVTGIDKAHQSRRFAVAGSGGIITRHLIAP